jgi:hypothetical protein
MRAGDSLDHLEEVIGPFHADRLRSRLSQTDVDPGDRIEYDFEGEQSSLTIVSDNFERATKYFDDLNRIEGDGLFAELETRTIFGAEGGSKPEVLKDGTLRDAPDGSNGDGDIERLSYVKAITDAYDAARMARTLAFFRNMNRRAGAEEQLPGEGWLRLVARLPFKELRLLVRATVADMRADLAEASNLEACKRAERDGRIALLKIVVSVVWDLVKGAVAFGKVVQEIKRLIG